MPAGRREVAPAQGAAPPWRRSANVAAVAGAPRRRGRGGAGVGGSVAIAAQAGARRGRQEGRPPPTPQAPPSDEGAGQTTERRVTPKVL